MTVTVVKGEFIAPDLDALKGWFRKLEDDGIFYSGYIESYEVTD